MTATVTGTIICFQQMKRIRLVQADHEWCFVPDIHNFYLVYMFPAGEYRLPREDGAHYQGVPHPRQPLGSVLQPVSRAHRHVHTGTAHVT